VVTKTQSPLLRSHRETSAIQAPPILINSLKCPPPDLHPTHHPILSAPTIPSLLPSGSSYRRPLRLKLSARMPCIYIKLHSSISSPKRYITSILFIDIPGEGKSADILIWGIE
jgi:hypothetical protein